MRNDGVRPTSSYVLVIGSYMLSIFRRQSRSVAKDFHRNDHQRTEKHSVMVAAGGCQFALTILARLWCAFQPAHLSNTCFPCDGNRQQPSLEAQVSFSCCGSKLLMALDSCDVKVVDASSGQVICRILELPSDFLCANSLHILC